MDNLRTLLRVTTFVQEELKQDLVLSYLAIFLLVCVNEPVTMPEIGERLSLTQTTVSRGVKTLSRYKEKGEIQGFDLVFSMPDIEERRRFAVHLTPKGKELRDRLASLIATDLKAE